MKRFLSIGLAILMISALITGCSSKPEKALQGLGQDEQATIKVMYFDDSYFFMKYGNLFNSKFPNIEIEVANAMSLYMNPSSDPMKALREFIDENKPDVLLLDPYQYTELAQNGELYELSGVISQDKFDTDGMLPSVIELLKEKGEGGLYGLAPSFYSQALIYNVDLFNEFNVEPPHDGMTWEEVFNLAKAFATDGNEEDRTYGFYMPSYGQGLFYLTHAIGAAYGLSYVDTETDRFLFDSDEWREVYALAIEAMKSGAVYDGSGSSTIDINNMDSFYKQDKFLYGKAAMTLNGLSIEMMIEQARSIDKDLQNFNWDMVTVPIDPADPTTTPYLNLNEIFAIRADSANLRAAWELVKFVNSEEMAKVQGNSFDGSLQTRTQFIQNKENRNLEALYSLKPKYEFLEDYVNTPTSFYEKFAEIVERETRAVLDDQISMETAINRIQDQGQEVYLRVKEEEKAKKEAEEKDQD